MTIREQIKALQEDRARLGAEMKSVNDKLEKGDDPGIRQRGANLLVGIAKIDDQITGLQKAESDGIMAAVDTGQPFDGIYYHTEPNPAAGDVGVAGNHTGPNRSLSTVSRDSVALTKDQKMADWVRARGEQPPANVSMASILKGIAHGTWDEPTRMALFNSQSVSVGSEGGFLTPPTLSADIIDLARNKMRTIEAGATTVPLPSGEHSIARVKTDPTSSWRSENAAIPETAAVFEKIVFRAKVSASLVKIPLELLDDSMDRGAAAELEELMSKSIALELDRVSLYGDGDQSEPVGLTNTTGVLDTDLAGAPADYDFIINAAGKVEDANFTVNAAITSPRVGRQLGLLKTGIASDKTPLRRPERVNYPILETNQVPADLGAGSNESHLIVGDWPNLLIGVRTGLQLFPLRERFLDNGQLGLIAWIRADIQVARPTAFHFASGIDAS